jgi:hypothetical protein
MHYCLDKTFMTLNEMAVYNMTQLNQLFQTALHKTFNITWNNVF